MSKKTYYNATTQPNAFVQPNVTSTIVSTHTDTIFTKDYQEKFEFNDIVASVFDDMIERSIPFYNEVIDIAIFFIMQYIQTHYINKQISDIPIIYDLGSSTGNFLLRLDNILQEHHIHAGMYGIDNSPAMIERARLKANAMGSNIAFIIQDFLQTDFKATDIFLSFYTMQFVRPLYRQDMIQRVYNALKKNGIFLLAEKVISQDSKLETQMIACYHEYKTKRGYTQGEIYKKREALENILVPYSVYENPTMLENCGFSHIEILFKWVNFVLFLARKG